MCKVWGNWEVSCTKYNCCSWPACQKHSVSILNQSWKIAHSFQAILCALSRFSPYSVGHTDSTPHGRLHVITQEGAAMVTHTSFFFFLSFLFSVFNKWQYLASWLEEMSVSDGKFFTKLITKSCQGLLSELTQFKLLTSSQRNWGNINTFLWGCKKTGLEVVPKWT